MKPKIKVFYKKPVYIKTVMAYEREKARRQENCKRSSRLVICDTEEDVVFKREEERDE